MSLTALLRSRVKSARRRQAGWVRLFDLVRLIPSAEGRARLWTRFVHREEVHQTTPETCDDRYPELFDLSARLKPNAERILSFGCSTGEELVSLRRRFPTAMIVGAEINPRSRRIAAGRIGGDPHIRIVAPRGIDGSFDLVFALAVFQREPLKIAEMQVEDLRPYYPFARFDQAVSDLVERLKPGGLLCVANAHYRVEDSSRAAELEAVGAAPRSEGLSFGRDGRRIKGASGGTLFRRRA